MFKSIKNLILIVVVLVGICFAMNFVLAADVEIGLEYGKSTGLSDTDPRTMVANIIKIALAFLGIIALILIIYGGFLWMTAAGNEEKVETARKVLVSAVIGLIIILSAFGITTFLLNSITSALGPGGDPGPGPGPGPIIPPGPETNCDLISITLECEIDESKCKDGYFCDGETCQCKRGGSIGDDCGILEPVCLPDKNDCASSLYCNDECECDIRSEVFEACNATSTGGCEPNQDICSSDLTCDTGDCFCKEFPVIKGVSPTGGFCIDELNKPCLRDSDCVSTATSSCNTDVPNAALGNIITIYGRYFGATTGEVRFYDGSGTNILGIEPQAPCDVNWSDDQIIIIVPPGVRTGPILVRTADGEEDVTDNTQGPMLPNLLINNISRPGLCKLDREEGRLGDIVSYYGIKFSPVDGEARFGRYNGFLAGKNSVFLTTVEGSSGVPSISSGNVTSFVSDANGRTSNYLKFRKLSEIERGPYIDFFEPKSGAGGQYVTIHGDGFGYEKGLSKVYFGSSGSGVEADYTFPDVCADSVWGDEQIIVKVPDGATLNDGNYEITIALELDSVEIDTSQISPTTFEVDNSLLLSPSLCKMSPIIGQPSDTISFWGEYFDDFEETDSKVRFTLNNDMIGSANISFWDIDPENSGDVDVYKVETTVHLDVSEGPVRIVKGDPEISGNGINFKVGSCLEAEDPDNACGAEICCLSDTYKAGKCAASADDCHIDIPNSVYEWNFSTSPATTDIDDPESSCIEKSRLLGTCEVDICPNSAGSCSFFAGGLATERDVTGDCSFTCDIGACEGVGCSYDSTIDRCLDDTRTICSISATTTDIYGKDVATYCERYEGNPRMVIDNNKNTSCPSGWTNTLGTSTSTKGEYLCVDESSSCTICREGFICFDDDDGDSEGLCVIDKDICKEGSVCESDNYCRTQVEEDCECCCRIANDNEDCCEALTCAGSCGSDKNLNNNTNTFGYCSGCRTDIDNDGNIDANEQAISDEKCVCSGSTGKFCDVDVDIDGDGNPEGVCRDCAQLSDTSSCTAHNTTCCVDAMDNDNCQGGAGTFGIGPNANTAYCGYYQCNDENTVCEDGSGSLLAIADTASTSGKYFLEKDVAACNKECHSPSLIGRSCAPKISTSTCDTSFCPDLSCLNEDGLGPVAPSACGICCCDPNWETNPLLDEDQCESLNPEYPDLSCQADKGSCSGAERGLCCGCEDNNSCGRPEQLGCGTDTCCRARPEVTEAIPADFDSGVCPNAQIRVTFNETMNTNSFSTNIIVVGEYDDLCPEGTIYLAKAGKNLGDRNVIVRTFYKYYNRVKEAIKNILGKETYASVIPDPQKYYCAIVGSVDNEQMGESGTILKFSPTNMLDTGRKYYAIVKGDADLDNGKGVLSFWDIGINVGAESPVDNTISVFNGISYPGSYIWSFTTMEKQDLGSSGVCEIDHVDVSPYSYLFQTTINDFNENDTNPNSKTFDTEKDKDKKFTAYALSLDNQILIPVPDYDWIWNWSINDASVVNIISSNGAPFDSNDESQLVEARNGVVDKKTYLNASVSLTSGTVGDGETGTADVQVFLCENPWPPVNINGSWTPWVDDGGNCIPGTGQCLNTNYLLYYCRDQGEFGVVDDLPSILSEAVIRGANDEILKESYFFREGRPEIQGVSLSGSSLVRGEGVALSWNALTSPDETIDKYIIYFDEDSGYPYANKVEASLAEAPHTTGMPLLIEGLENNTNYYFSVIAVYETGNSSDYSNEYMIRVADTEAPATPLGISHEFKNSTTTVEVSWLPNTDDTTKYRVYYSHLYNNPENYVEVGGIEADRASFNIQNRDGTYFVIVTALDQYGNESDWSPEMPVVPTGF